jgi:hypothetical protein
MAGALFQHIGVGAPYVLGAGITAGALALVLTLPERPDCSLNHRIGGSSEQTVSGLG